MQENDKKICTTQKKAVPLQAEIMNKHTIWANF